MDLFASTSTIARFSGRWGEGDQRKVLATTSSEIGGGCEQSASPMYCRCMRVRSQRKITVIPSHTIIPHPNQGDPLGSFSQSKTKLLVVVSDDTTRSVCIHRNPTAYAMHEACGQNKDQTTGETSVRVLGAFPPCPLLLLLPTVPAAVCTDCNSYLGGGFPSQQQSSRSSRLRRACFTLCLSCGEVGPW